MRVFLDLERPSFHGAPKRVERADAGIAGPGEDELLRAARRNHLVVDQVRRQAAQGQVAAPLANDLVTCGKRDQVGEPFDHDDVAVAHVPRDGILHRHDF